MNRIDFRFPVDFNDDKDIIEYLINHMNNPLKRKMCSDKDDLFEQYDLYLDLMSKNQIHLCNTFSKLKDDSFITTNLNYGDFKNLYSYHLSDKKKQGRKIYDYLMSLSDGGICPYCEISEVTGLDHVLPKSSFPQYSIFLQNLVPSCSKCNSTEKLDAVSDSESDQIIHPYLDSDFYFDEQWIKVIFFDEKGLEADNIVDIESIIYVVDTPINWTSSQQEKANYNFEIFNLGQRFSSNASKELNKLKHKIKNPSALYRTRSTLSNLSDNDLLEVIIVSNLNLHLSANHWESIFYKALTELLENNKNNIQNSSAKGEICPRCKGKWQNSSFSCDICSGGGYIGHSYYEKIKDNYDYPIDCPFCNFGEINCEKCHGNGKIDWNDIGKYLSYNTKE